ncbi:MAG: hypothetical protein ACQESR_12590 [Planctomycetota bacterium]
MESGPTQAVLPLVGLATDNVIRDRYNGLAIWSGTPASWPHTGRNALFAPLVTRHRHSSP